MRILHIKHRRQPTPDVVEASKRRLGCTGTIEVMRQCTSLVFSYKTDSQGMPKTGYMVTSRVESMYQDKTPYGVHLIVVTENTIYVFGETH